MRKELPKVSYEISFMNGSGKTIKRITRLIQGVLNNGVVKKISIEEKINYNYWVTKKKDGD